MAHLVYLNKTDWELNCDEIEIWSGFYRRRFNQWDDGDDDIKAQDSPNTELYTSATASRQAGLNAKAGPHTPRPCRARRIRLSASSWWSRSAGKAIYAWREALTEAGGTFSVNQEAAHPVIYHAHLSGTGGGFLSGVPSRGRCLGAEISGPKGRLCGCAKLFSS